MPRATSGRSLQYSCDRAWEEMPQVQGGRFCNACQKPVTDFTRMGKDELQAWFRSGAQGCGRFAVHQLDPSLMPVENVVPGMRRGLFAALAMLAISGARAQNVVPAPSTEQVDSVLRTAPASGTSQAAVDARNPKLDRATCPPIEPPAPPKAKMVTYLSWRFPFVHRVAVQRTYRMGYF